jgi:ABC-type lipoprotein export system ATPase subunit
MTVMVSMNRIREYLLLPEVHKDEEWKEWGLEKKTEGKTKEMKKIKVGEEDDDNNDDDENNNNVVIIKNGTFSWGENVKVPMTEEEKEEEKKNEKIKKIEEELKKGEKKGSLMNDNGESQETTKKYIKEEKSKKKEEKGTEGKEVEEETNGDKTALKNITLSLKKGSLTMVIGSVGCGKSSLVAGI